MSDEDFLQYFSVDIRREKVLILELRRELAEASGLSEQLIRPSDQLFVDLVSADWWPIAEAEAISDFMEDHCKRLRCSASELGLTKVKTVEDYINTLVSAYSRNIVAQ